MLEAVKISGSESRVSSSMASADPTSAPPQEPSVLENVIVIRSTSETTPWCSAAPRPRLAEHAQAVGFVVEQERVGVLAAQRVRARASGAVSPPME